MKYAHRDYGKQHPLMSWELRISGGPMRHAKIMMWTNGERHSDASLPPVRDVLMLQKIFWTHVLEGCTHIRQVDR